MSVPDRSGTEVSHLLNNETDAFLAMIRNAYEKKKNKKRVEDFTLLPSKEVNPYLIEPVEKQVETFKAPFIPEHTPVVEVDEYAVALQDEVSSLPVTGSTTTEYGIYRVKSGDALERIARKFKVKTRALAKLNGLKLSDILHIGDPINIPYSQEMVDYITSAEYTVKQGDTLITIAQKFDLTARKLATFNKLDVDGIIGEGKKLKLPLPYKLAEIRAREALKNKYKNYGNKKLRVTATAYTSHHGQTDSTPFLAAWNNRLRPGMKVIAVSRDMLTQYGMKNGTKVRIAGLPGIYHVRDKMNKRYKKRIDIYMGLDLRRALQWGKRSVVIYWN